MRTIALALIPRAVALNLVLGAVVSALKLPVSLDSVGTILVAALVGPWAGIVTGVVSNTVLGLLSTPTFFAFIPVAIVIGWLAGVAAWMGAFRSVAASIVAGVILGTVAGIASVPIVIALFGGVTASGTGMITLLLRALHLPLPVAAGLAITSTDIVDKVLSCVLVAMAIARLPHRLTVRFDIARSA